MESERVPPENCFCGRPDQRHTLSAGETHSSVCSLIEVLANAEYYARNEEQGNRICKELHEINK